MTEIIAIYAPMIYTALCVMIWMRADPLQGQVVGGLALEIETFLGPGKLYHIVKPKILNRVAEFLWKWQKALSRTGKHPVCIWF